MIFKLESAYQEELDALRADFRVEGLPSKLLWLTCEDCGARYFAYVPGTAPADGVHREFEALPESVARDALEIIEFDCPRHDNLFEL